MSATATAKPVNVPVVIGVTLLVVFLSAVIQIAITVQFNEFGQRMAGNFADMANESMAEMNGKNNLKQLGLALHNYHDAFAHFPSPQLATPLDEPDEALSWTVPLLPYLEQIPLYEQFDLDQGWASEQNRQAALTDVDMLIVPERGYEYDANDYMLSHFAAVGGVADESGEVPQEQKGVLAHREWNRFRNVLDGASNTLMLVEINKDLGPWAKAGQGTYREVTAEPVVNGPDGIGGAEWDDGFVVLFADGRVERLSKNIDPETFKALVTAAAGEIVDVDEDSANFVQEEIEFEDF